MLVTLRRIRSVNLRSIASAMDSKAEIDSCYRRLQRFFAFLEMQLLFI